MHFFADEDAAQIRTHQRPGTYVVSIAEGFEYGRLYNHGRLGAALAEQRGAEFPDATARASVMGGPLHGALTQANGA